LATHSPLENMDLAINAPETGETPARKNAFIKMLRRRRWFLAFVVLPTLLAAVYYTFIAADVFQSESRFVIKAPSQKQMQSASIANLIQSTGISSGLDQTNEVIDYIQSRDALRALVSQSELKAQFSSPEADWASRYPGPFRDDRFENLYKYYGKMISVHIDHDTNSAVLTAKAFTPADAQKLNEQLLRLSEQLVNRLNARFQNKAIAEAERRVADAQLRVRNARLAMGQYRNARDVVDPSKEAEGVLEISNKLVTEQAGLRAQLATMQRLAPRNPGIGALRDRIASIDAQIGAQTGRAVGTSNGLASKMTKYDELQVDQEFATQLLTTASATLEQARTEAMKQQYYLERVVEPDRPDVAQFPKRLIGILTVAGVALALYFIGWMLIVGILEHAPED